MSISKSMSKIIGRDGRLVWDNFPVALKYWMIEWDKPDGGKESWHGKAILSQRDLCAMMQVRTKVGPIPINEPILAEFPMENHINQKQEAIYSPPPDGLLLPAFAIEMAPSSRISAFFLLPSFR